MTEAESRSGPALSLRSAQAVLFDLDGVLTDTASVHRRAWRKLFTDYLARHAPQARPYETADYYTWIDGRTRADGVRSFLGSREIVLPDGDSADPPGDDTVNALGNRKNEEFQQVLTRDGAEVFEGSVRLVRHLADRGVPMAVVSSSRNARQVLRVTGLDGYFPVVVDGAVVQDEGLPGKPAPDMFLRAARLLGVEPARSVVIEDAQAGVAAGRAGDFQTVGVDRSGSVEGRAGLRAAGADRIVDDLAELLAGLDAAAPPTG